MTRSEAIHILRNPYGKSQQECREAALFICDEVELLERQSIYAKRYAFLREGKGIMPYLGITTVGEMLDYALDKAMRAMGTPHSAHASSAAFPDDLVTVNCQRCGATGYHEYDAKAPVCPDCNGTGRVLAAKEAKEGGA